MSNRLLFLLMALVALAKRLFLLLLALSSDKENDLINDVDGKYQHLDLKPLNSLEEILLFTIGLRRAVILG